MTHYSHHCLHLGCGEPLGEGIASAVSIKKPKKAGTTSRRSRSEREKRALKKQP